MLQSHFYHFTCWLPVQHANRLRNSAHCVETWRVIMQALLLHQPLMASPICTHRHTVPRLAAPTCAWLSKPPSVAVCKRIKHVKYGRAAVQEQTGTGDSSSHAMEDSDEPSFVDLGVDNLFMAGVKRLGIESPAAIQAAAIPSILQGKNCAVQSYTGSGKTLAYLLPIMTLAIQRAEAAYKNNTPDASVQALVIAPSQELAMQIVRVAQALMPAEGRTAVQQCIGGANIRYQQEALVQNQPVLVVGTPGRLSELVRMGILKLHKCPVLVLDEADQLLSPHFSEDMTHLTEHTGKRLPARQTILISATLSESLLGRTAKWCPQPQYITAGPRITSAAATQAAAAGAAAAGAAPAWGWGAKGWDGPASTAAPRVQGSVGGAEQDALVPTMPPQLRHFYVVSEPRHKVDTLRRCIYALDSQRSLVFMNFQQRLKDTQFKLEARNMEVATLHGEMTKLQRANVLNNFRQGQARTLIVSDVMARGLDIAECGAVFHLELPSNASHYAHRAGRTGRMGAEGTVVSIVSPSEVFVVDKLANKLGVPILEAHVAQGQLVMGPAPPEPRPAKRQSAERSRPSRRQLEQQQQQQAARSTPHRSDASDDKAHAVGEKGRRASGSVSISSSADSSRNQAASVNSTQPALTSTSPSSSAAVAQGEGRAMGTAGASSSQSKTLGKVSKGKSGADSDDDDDQDGNEAARSAELKLQLRKELEDIQAEKTRLKEARYKEKMAKKGA